jgi:tRNA pseudouridine55 synthase
MTAEDYKNGQLLLIDKPLTWTSFQVVNKLRWAIRTKYGIKKIKVGHAGTLDPLATGLLIICTGKFTKKINEYQGLEKEYTGTITLGATTPSYDLETEIDATFSLDHITEELLHETTKEFTGDIMQAPPIFSALKSGGERMYKKARRGEVIDIPKRQVSVYAFEITNIDLPKVDFRIACSKGTYIRSIAHDFGKSLQSGGHLSALKRTKIGAITLENAIDPIAFVKELGIE